MDQRASDSREDIRQDIEDTRAAVTEQIELLEERVRETVEEAKTTVKQAVNIHHYVYQWPWQMIGLSVLTGYWLGRWVAPPLKTVANSLPVMTPSEVERGNGQTESRPPTSSLSVTASQVSAKSESMLLSAFEDELTVLKRAAVGAVIGLVRDLVRQSVPALDPYLPAAANTAREQSTSLSPTTTSPASVRQTRSHSGRPESERSF